MGQLHEKHGWLHIDSTALFVLFVPPFAYAVAFNYESAYTAYFGIPDSLAEATLASLIREGKEVCKAAASPEALGHGIVRQQP
jgi:hypothetical protein